MKQNKIKVKSQVLLIFNMHAMSVICLEALKVPLISSTICV